MRSFPQSQCLELRNRLSQGIFPTLWALHASCTSELVAGGDEVNLSEFSLVSIDGKLSQVMFV